MRWDAVGCSGMRWVPGPAPPVLPAPGARLRLPRERGRDGARWRWLRPGIEGPGSGWESGSEPARGRLCPARHRRPTSGTLRVPPATQSLAQSADLSLKTKYCIFNDTSTLVWHAWQPREAQGILIFSAKPSPSGKSLLQDAWLPQFPMEKSPEWEHGIVSRMSCTSRNSPECGDREGNGR